MTGHLAPLLLGLASGIALVIVLVLTAPVIRGWRDDRRPVADDWALATPGTIATRLIDHLLAAGAVALLLLAFRLGGVL